MILHGLAVFLLHFSCQIESISVGFIRDTVVMSASSTLVSISSSYDACVCAMLMATDIVSVSYFSNKTCVAIHDYSLPYALMGSANSSFSFLSLPAEQSQSTEKLVTDAQTGLYARLVPDIEPCVSCS